MKFGTLLTVLLIGFTAFAQDNAPTSELTLDEAAPTSNELQPDSSKQGIYVGLDYMNLTSAKSHSENNWGQSYSYNGGESLGLGGIRLGYADTPSEGFGYSAGVRYNESLVRSEYDTEKIKFIIPEANLQYSLNKYVLGFVGLNTAWLTSSYNDFFKPDLGGQIGVGVRPVANIQINAGLTILRQKLNYKYNDYVEAGTEEDTGFTTSLNYLF